jgi:hypothetical protein
MPSLWGDLSRVPETRTPETVLREQASHLTDETRGKLVGEVRMVSRDQGARPLVATLYARVPAMDDYRQVIVRVAYDGHGYPATVYRLDETNGEDAADEGALTAALARALGSAGVRKVLGALLGPGRDH